LFCFLVFRNKKSTQSTVHASLPVTKSAPPANPVVVGTVGFDQGSDRRTAAQWKSCDNQGSARGK